MSQPVFRRIFVINSPRTGPRHEPEVQRAIESKTSGKAPGAPPASREGELSRPVIVRFHMFGAPSFGDSQRPTLH